MSKIIIKNDVQIDGSDSKLFSVFEEGKERAGLTFGIGKARKLHAILNGEDADLTVEFIDKLRTFVEAHDGATAAGDTPSKVQEHEGSKYGLFKDGAIKIERVRNGKPYWAAVTGGMKDVIKPEHFDGTPIPIVGKASKGGGASSAAVLAQIEEMRKESARKDAMILAMMAKLGVEVPV